MYNEQKRAIEELKKYKFEQETEKRGYRDKIEELEKANARLKADANKEAEHKNETLTKRAVN